MTISSALGSLELGQRALTSSAFAARVSSTYVFIPDLCGVRADSSEGCSCDPHKQCGEGASGAEVVGSACVLSDLGTWGGVPGQSV